MRNKRFRLCALAMFCVLIAGNEPVRAAQSLVDAARAEAERRKEIERLGIEDTVIEGNGECRSGTGNVSLFSPSEIREEKTGKAVSPSKDKSALRKYRTRLQKLDRDISKDEARIKKLRNQLLELRRRNLLIRDISKIAGNEESQDRTRIQIEELQDSLKLRRRERAEVYDEGKREGFLPGELEGRGIIP